jgi:glycosyltransferase involved in cell wall biosynthesis
MSDPEVRLVLSMIVRNESRVIDRCLDSALSIAQGFVISDTGSTDDTKERIALAGKRHEVPGIVVTDPWKNFGWNRTRAANATRRWVKEKSWDLDHTYMLLLDADMVLRVLPSFKRQALSAVYYQIEQRSPSLSWLNTRLCRLSHNWEAIGVTHEYWAPAPNASPERLDSLYIEDVGDGGAKGDKTARDIRLLTDGLKAEPDNVRYYFYLAQSYFDVGNYAAALPLYEERRRRGGWADECWYSLFKMGLCELRLGHDREGTRLLHQAFEERPGRAESVAHLARFYRERGSNNLAVLFAREALRIPVSTESLFVETTAHLEMPLEDLGISAYYTPHKDEGRLACAKLLSLPGSREFHNHILRCTSFYAKPIAPLAVRRGTFAIPEELLSAPGPFLGTEENKTRYLPKNPSIAHLGPGSSPLVSVNLVNYHHERGVIFAPKDPDGIVRTRNVNFVWDPVRAETTHLREFTPSEWPGGWAAEPHVRGLEDVRLFAHRQQIWFTATCFHPPTKPGSRHLFIPSVVLGKLGPAGVEHLTALTYARAGHCEKNWLPWSNGEQVFMLYGYDPLVVLEVDVVTGVARETSRRSPGRSAASWRGGAPPEISPWGRLVFIVHEVAHFDDRRVYMHRFVELDRERSLSRCSLPFVIDHAGVEYVAGLLSLGETAIVTYGHEEREARWAEFSWEDIGRLLGEDAL